MNYELVKVNKDMEKQYNEFIAEWNESEEKISPHAVNPQNMTYKEWLDYTCSFENKETCPPNFVTAHTYFLVNDNQRILGAINIRHYLNENLLKVGGHIGYGIRPSERKRGYATLMLSLALPIAKELGIDKALITCKKANIGSAKTIMNNGGVLENEITDEKNEIFQRYWVELK